MIAVVISRFNTELVFSGISRFAKLGKTNNEKIIAATDISFFKKIDSGAKNAFTIKKIE